MVATTTSTPAAKRTTKAERARAGILKALHAAIGEARVVAKDGRNALSGYSYAKAEDIIAEARAVLARHELAVLQTSSAIRRDQAGDRILVTRWSLMHTVHGETDLGEREWPIVEDRQRDLGKAFAAADTSSLAYFLRNLLQLERTEQGGQIDDEGNPRENLMTLDGLRARIASAFERRGVPDDARALESERLLGRLPHTYEDHLQILKALTYLGAEE